MANDEEVGQGPPEEEEEAEPNLGEVVEALYTLNETIDTANLGLVSTWLEDVKSGVHHVSSGLSEIADQLKEINKNLAKLVAQKK